MAVKISRIMTFPNKEFLPIPEELEKPLGIASEFELSLLKNKHVLAFTEEVVKTHIFKKTFNYFFEDKEAAINFLLTLMSEKSFIEPYLINAKYRLDNGVTIEWAVDFNYPR